MKIEKAAIKKYKLNQWVDIKEGKIIYGIDVVMTDGNTYHCYDGRIPRFFADKKEALQSLANLNAELKP